MDPWFIQKCFVPSIYGAWRWEVGVRWHAQIYRISITRLAVRQTQSLFRSSSSLSVSVSSGDGVRSWGCRCVVDVSDATDLVLLQRLSVCTCGAAAPPPQLLCLLPEDDFRVGLILLVVSSSFGGSPLSWRDKVSVTLFILARLPMVPPNVLIGFCLGTGVYLSLNFSGVLVLRFKGRGSSTIADVGTFVAQKMHNCLIVCLLVESAGPTATSNRLPTSS